MEMFKRVDRRDLDYNKVSKETSLTKTPLFMCPRYDEPPGDDIDESDFPLGWKELSKLEKEDILDYEMDLYWREIIKPINWWTISTFILAFTNLLLLCYI